MHLDFHPLNVIMGPGRLGVLDWGEADVADVHADVAATLTITDCTCATHKGGWARPLAELTDADAFCQRVLAFALGYADLARRDWTRFVGARADLDNVAGWASTPGPFQP